MTLAIFIGLLVTGGVYLVMQRGMVRITLGFVLLSHGANLMLIAAGVTARREAPLTHLTELDEAADALPQAFALTAIVIAFSITIYMLALAGAGDGAGDDDTDDSPPDATDEPEPPHGSIGETAAGPAAGTGVATAQTGGDAAGGRS